MLSCSEISLYWLVLVFQEKKKCIVPRAHTFIGKVGNGQEFNIRLHTHSETELPPPLSIKGGHNWQWPPKHLPKGVQSQSAYSYCAVLKQIQAYRKKFTNFKAMFRWQSVLQVCQVSSHRWESKKLVHLGKTVLIEVYPVQETSFLFRYIHRLMLAFHLNKHNGNAVILHSQGHI